MVFESYVEKGGEKLRRGFTTGSAAAAAAKGAAKMLFKQSKVEEVTIDTPAGLKLNLELVESQFSDDSAQAAVVKDAGDDPDVTDGLKIRAQVKKAKAGISIKGGKGVGKVTKPGLPPEVGKAAINPVPRQMITQEVKSVLPSGEGCEVVIEVPRGEEIAEKTLNPKLGIKGGLSILGTTGIVEPMSDQAYKDSLALAIDQALASGKEELALVFGNYGQEKAAEFGFDEEQIVRMSNYVGFMLNKCVEKEVDSVVLVGQIGKLVKVAAGIFNTHSKVADARLETIAAYTASLGAKPEIIRQILAANTSEEAVQIIYQVGYEEVFSVLLDKLIERVREYTEKKLSVEAVFFSLEEGVLADSREGDSSG